MPTHAPPAVAPTCDSDYGSDLDGEEVLELLSQVEAASFGSLVLENLEDDAPRAASIRLPPDAKSSTLSPPHTDVAYSQRPEGLARQEPVVDPPLVQRERSRRAALDERSPLERFRKSPKKPLSVTDIVSPAWCELQYWYTLTKHGRKRRTPAMKQGTKVHKELEDQVHKTVEVVVQSREDTWGLKIWNIIQGLRTLRQTGHTRELEVWGVIDGEVINGIIDELTHTCPDEGLEELALARLNRLKKQPDNQTSVSNRQQDAGAAILDPKSLVGEQHPSRKIWITDVKARGTKTLPQVTSKSPTAMQLMMYRKLLADLATGSVDADAIFKRYRLQAAGLFSDAFVEELGRLDSASQDESIGDQHALSSSQLDSVTELLAHRSLTKLWDLMIEEFQKTISGPSAIGQVLRAEFRYSQTGDILGSKAVVYDETTLDEYLAEEMSWWRGERKAKGVDIEEAFKCRICEFAEECEWRKEKIDDAAKTNRKRKAIRSKSTV